MKAKKVSQRYTDKEKLELIDDMVSSDFVVEMCSKRHRPEQLIKYRTKDVDKAIDTLAFIYGISHTIHCEACNKTLKQNVIMENHREEESNE